MPGPLIIVGQSTRAAARSAVDAGYQPWCLDTRGDRDLREGGVIVRTCPPDQFPASVLRMLDEAPRNAPVLLTSPMENHPDVVRAIAFGRPLLGSSADAIAAVRSPDFLPSLKPIPGVLYPRAGRRLSLARRLGQLFLGGFVKGARHLLKPRLSSHGLGVEWYPPGERVPATHYVQQYVRGTPHTAVFTADGWSAFLLGVTEQIVGDAAFGAASAFHDLGDVGPVKLSEKGRAALSRLAVQISQKFDVRGVFGVDFIMDHGGKFWPIEVNPRYPAAAEVLERAEGIRPLAGTGAAARAGRETTVMQVARAAVIARRDGIVPDLFGVVPRGNLADVPDAGRPVGAGEMICSVLASGAGRDAALAQLRELAKRVYAVVEPPAVALPPAAPAPPGLPPPVVIQVPGPPPQRQLPKPPAPQLPEQPKLLPPPPPLLLPPR